MANPRLQLYSDTERFFVRIFNRYGEKSQLEEISLINV